MPSKNDGKEVKYDKQVDNYTEDQIQEIIKCKNDIFYFAENYFHVKHPSKGVTKVDLEGRDYQKKFVKTFMNNRFSILLAARQMGKCHHLDSEITVRNKKTGEVEQITIGDFFARMSNNQ